MFNQQQHQRQSTSESIEAGAPQTCYYIHAGSNNNTDALTTTSCYSNVSPTATATYVMQQQQQQQNYHRVAMEHDMSAVSYENTSQMRDISLAEKEVDQYPTIEEFDKIVQGYLDNLSTKKRDKALVDRHRYTLITRVLKDPRNTAISTAQFRFWVKKMFQLVPSYDGSEIVCHDNKPVAMREDIYDILVQAHKQANHGGRDKTSALVRRQYSWIPKELIARFVRHCPFCIARRCGGQNPPISLLPRTPPAYTEELPATAAAAAAAANAAFPAQDGRYHTEPASSLAGLSYLQIDFKPIIGEKDFDIRWHDHHQAQQQQQPCFQHPLGSPKGTAAPSPASSVAGPMSVHGYSNVLFSTVAAANTSSYNATSCQPLETGDVYHHPALLSPCDGISALHYGHVEQPPPVPPYSTCYVSSPESSMDPLTIITPQHQLCQEQQQHSSSNTNDFFATSDYASHQQAIPYDHKMTDPISPEPRQHHHQQTMVYPYTISSPSPSSSLSSSSSYSVPSSPLPLPPGSQPSEQTIYMQQHQQPPSLTTPLFSNRSF